MNWKLREELNAKHAAIVELCRKYAVASLEVFGSGTRDDWGPLSDIDFLVTLKPLPNGGLADRLLGLAEELEALFGRRVELITPRSIRNPYFRHNVEATRAPVYAE